MEIIWLRATGILAISDFRQKHIAAGGEERRWPCMVNHLLAYHLSRENRILLNAGGIRNPALLARRREAKVAVADTGPGNTLLDRIGTKANAGNVL